MPRGKKAVAPKRVKVGIAGVPKDTFANCKQYFHLDVDKKEYSKVVKEYAKKNYSKEDYRAITANAEYKFTMFSHLAAACYWDSLGLEFPENYPAKENLIESYLNDLIAEGKYLLAEKAKEEDAKSNVVRLTPQQLMARKVNETLISELDELEDAWIAGEKATFNMYERFRAYELKGAAVEYVRRHIEPMVTEYTDALEKRCEQAVEGYSNLTKTELRRRVKVLNEALSDLDRLKEATKATRTVRAKKPASVDKQIARVKYKKEDAELKLASINPALIVGANRLLVVNAKYKTVAEYVTDSAAGFSIKGTTLQNFDPEKSRQKKMRKPDEFIPFLKKTARQFDKAFNALSTKESAPNGRLNDETILIKVG